LSYGKVLVRSAAAYLVARDGGQILVLYQLLLGWQGWRKYHGTHHLAAASAVVGSIYIYHEATGRINICIMPCEYRCCCCCRTYINPKATGKQMVFVSCVITNADPLLLLLLLLLQDVHQPQGHWQADGVCQPRDGLRVRSAVRSAGHRADEDRPVPGLGVPGELLLLKCNML
jgi:hypothetical protein